MRALELSMHRIVFAFVLAASSAPAAAQPVAPSPTAESQPKFETPEACHKASLAATRSQDYVALLHCVSEAHANFILGETAHRLRTYQSFVSGAPSEATRAAEAALRKHGLLQVDTRDLLVMADSRVERGMVVCVIQIGNAIRDPKAFLRDATAAKKLIEQELRSTGQPIFADEVAKSKDPTLVNVQIMGDKAQAGLKLPDSDEPAGPLYFVREKGSWVMALDESEPDWRRPIPDVTAILEVIKKKP